MKKFVFRSGKKLKETNICEGLKVGDSVSLSRLWVIAMEFNATFNNISVITFPDCDFGIV